MTEWALNDKYTVYKSTDIFKAWTLSAADARKADSEQRSSVTNYLKISLIFTRHRGDKEEATTDSGASHV